MTRYLLALLLLLPIDASAVGRVFYDGFEDGTVAKWAKDDYRNFCVVVASSVDGVAGPFAGSKMARCNWNGTVAWNAPDAFENLVLLDAPYTSELFVRVRVRLDKDVEHSTASAAKLLRTYQSIGGPYNELFESAYPGAGLTNSGNAGTKQLSTYWGGAAGDNTGSSVGWHKIERYTNQVTGTVREWHDGVLIRNDTAPFTGRWFPFYIMSNWADPHDKDNHVYFDEVEVYSDAGTGATGLMSDATVQVAVVVVPPPVDPAITALQAQVAALQAQGATDKATIAALQAKIAQAKTDLQ